MEGAELLALAKCPIFIELKLYFFMHAQEIQFQHGWADLWSKHVSASSNKWVQCEKAEREIGLIV